jgi:hypothetical protein
MLGVIRLLSLLSLALMPAALRAAPTYKEQSDVPEQRQFAAAVNEMIRTGNVTDQDQFDGVVRYKIAEFTLKKSEPILHKLRRNLQNNRKSARGTAHARINDLLLKGFQAIAQDPEYSPAARVNAMLIIGELNERDVALGSMDTPVPLPAAVPVLLAAANSGKNSTGTDDAVALAAFAGLKRHLESPNKIGNADQMRQLIEMMSQLASADEKPASRSADVHAYFRARAAEILGVSGAVGVPPRGTQAFQALQSMIGDDKLDLTARCTAAEALGQLDLKAAQGIKVDQATELVNQLLLEVVKANVSRRELKTLMVGIRTALQGPESKSADAKLGLGAIAPAEQKEALASLNERVDKIVELIDDRKTQDEDLFDELTQLAMGPQ